MRLKKPSCVMLVKGNTFCKEAAARCLDKGGPSAVQRKTGQSQDTCTNQSYLLRELSVFSNAKCFLFFLSFTNKLKCLVSMQ